MLAINKAVSVTSSAGAASTVIDARGVDVETNVLLIMGGGEFGRPGKGFTVTNTGAPFGSGIAIDSNQIAVRGNQVLSLDGNSGGRRGIDTVDSPGTVLIEGNQIVGWGRGISVRGAGKTVRKNQVALNESGIVAEGTQFEVAGNVATGNFTTGFSIAGSGQVHNNAAYANYTGAIVFPQFTGPVVKNNFLGNQLFFGLFNVSTGLDATNNYWGGSSGPGPDPADDVGGSGTETVTPFASKAWKVKAPIKP